MKKIWTSVHGGWGDFLANYGNIRHSLKQHHADIADVVYFGLDKKLITFMKSQPDIGEVLHLEMSDHSDYWKYTVLAASDYELFKKVTGLNKSHPDLIPTHITNFYNIENPTLCNRFFDIVLTPPELNWNEVLPQEEFIVCQPYSCHSCPYNRHWPEWIEALNFLLDTSKFKVVLLGQIKSMYDGDFTFPYIEHPNLINLVGQTPSVIDLLNIVDRAEGIITTSNVLSMWSVVTKKPALVVCNEVIKTYAQYYYNWIHYDPNTVLDCSIKLSEFKSVVNNFLEGL